MLITYGNTIGKDLKDLEHVLDKHFSGGELGGLHILPFFPSSGDRGFAVINYDIVDPDLGTWDDIDRLGNKYYLMADFMLNHASIRSREFRDYMEKGDESEYKDMFVDWHKFWPGGEPTEEQRKALYCRKPVVPKKEFIRKDGKTVALWNTFFEEQIDLDPYAASTQKYYKENLSRIAEHVPLVRFDAFAYTTKKVGTNCFFVEPDVWNVLDIASKPLESYGTEVLLEIHENYKMQLKAAEHGYWVYDFALPMLLLHGLKSGRTDRLIHWLKICPHNQFTTLDTHDGIGVVDVVDLLDMDEIDLVRDDVDDITADLKPYMKFPMSIKKSDGKTHLYQMACTYYSALREEDDAYLLARLVQFYTPGIPQVYYVGLLAGKNDAEAIMRGEEPRSINRHSYSLEEVEEAVQKPMLQRMYEVMRFRNSYPAFNGDFSVREDLAPGLLEMTWTKDDLSTTLHADFNTKEYEVTYVDPDTKKICTL